MSEYKKITYKNKNYAVGEVKYNRKTVPIILDWDIYKKIKHSDKTWSISNTGSVVTRIKQDESVKEIHLHDVVMKLSEKPSINRSILHINKLGIDNRLENLMYDTVNKTIKKNTKKKDRIIDLTGSGIKDVNQLPSFVWYLKQNDTHGERFMVSIGDVQWKSSSSKTLSLRYKLEETKKYLRILKTKRKDLFDKYSMNSDLNSHGNELAKSFVEICNKAGYANINYGNTNKTDTYLKEDLKGLSKHEKILLAEFYVE